MCITCIYHAYSSQVVMWQVYTRNIHILHGIYFVSSIYILCIYIVNTEYMHSIYYVYTQSIYTEYVLVYTRIIPSIYHVHPIRKHEGAEQPLALTYSQCRS